MTNDLAITSSSRTEFFFSSSDILRARIRYEIQSTLVTRSDTPMIAGLLPMFTCTSNSGDKDTTSPVMRCWGIDLSGMTDIAIVSWSNEDGIQGSMQLPNSHDPSNVKTDTPWRHMKILRDQIGGQSDVVLHRNEGKKYRSRKLKIGSRKSSNLVSSGYIPRDYDTRQLSEVLSQHLSITSDTIAQNLSKLFELETLSRSKRYGDLTLSLIQKVSG